MVTAIKHKAFIIIALLLGGCSSNKSSWQCAVVPASPCRKLILAPKNTFQNLEVVFHKDLEGTRATLNVYGIPLKPNTEVALHLDGTNTYYTATVLEGGQRIVLPIELEQKLLEAVAQKKTLTLSVDRYRTEVNYEGFDEPFSHFQNDKTLSFFL